MHAKSLSLEGSKEALHLRASLNLSASYSTFGQALNARDRWLEYDEGSGADASRTNIRARGRQNTSASEMADSAEKMTLLFCQPF